MTFADDLAYLNSLDTGTQRAIINIHLADLEEAAFTRTDEYGERLQLRERLTKAEHAEGVRTAAVKELDVALQFDRDRVLAESITRANLLDAKAIEDVRNEDVYDSEDERDDIEANGPKQEYASGELVVLAGLHMGINIAKEQYAVDVKRDCNDTSDEKMTRNITDTAFSKQYPDRYCLACEETKSSFEVVLAPCTHAYCQSCLQILFKASFKDETLFPPRCCRLPIGGQKLTLLLPKDMRDEFVERQFEFSVEDRTYCHVKTCSAFIKPRPPPQRRARCDKCEAQTCFNCKQEYHFGRCPMNIEDEAVLALARRQGWRQCDRCSTMVELNFGCNHMTCRCSHQFCYVCGAQWKTCPCEQWDEERLLERAEEIADRDGELDGDVRAALIDEAVDNLRERHECEHEKFQWVRGQFQCDECLDELTQFIYRCRQCEVQLCWRCRYNRL